MDNSQYGDGDGVKRELTVDEAAPATPKVQIIIIIRYPANKSQRNLKGQSTQVI